MRRFLSIALLIVLGLPFAAPLFAVAAASDDLPACCRKGGKHHCVMQGMSDDSHDAQFRAPVEHCPYCPAAVGALHLHASVALDASGFAMRLQSEAAVVAQMESRWRIARDRSRQKRGPPQQLLS